MVLSNPTIPVHLGLHEILPQSNDNRCMLPFLLSKETPHFPCTSRSNTHLSFYYLTSCGGLCSHPAQQSDDPVGSMLSSTQLSWSHLPRGYLSTAQFGENIPGVINCIVGNTA